MTTTTRNRAKNRLVLVLTLSILPLSGFADDYYSPYVDQLNPTNVYWGDTHLHTNLSVDANGMGNNALTPNDAYRFAKGEAIRAHNGQLARLHRPLDFLVVADHAVNIGVLPRIALRDPLILKTEVGKRWAKSLKENPLPTGEMLNLNTVRTWTLPVLTHCNNTPCMASPSDFSHRFLGGTNK